MTRLAWLALLLSPAVALAAGPAPASGATWLENLFPQNTRTPHPGVVRVVATHPNGASLGSGALVAVEEQHGLVITNWHVVRDAAGLIFVAFPDGFQSPARVLKADREWDLAALAIWRPKVAPIPLATQAPRPGEPLTIAGYGSGSYREATGRCTQYVAPSGNQPAEMVELAAGARQGDSGGPILNQRGELAGVLFGTASGQTTGSYCGRVRNFLASVDADFRRLPSGPTMIAQQPPGGPAAVQPAAQPPPAPPVGPAPQPPMSQSPMVSIPAGPIVASRAENYAAPASPLDPLAAPPATVAIAPPSAPQAGSEPTVFDQVRNILAGIGLFAVFFHGLRLLGAGGSR